MRIQEAVLNFMRELELPLPHDDRPGPQVGNFTAKDFKRLRDLVKEETTEFCEALSYVEINLERIENGSPPGFPHDTNEENLIHWWAQTIDAMCDILVVTLNVACAMNLDLEPFFNEVHRTNMAKAGGPVREDGKKLKPEGWEPPKIRELLEDQLRRYKDMEFGKKKEHKPFHTKEPLVALIYEIARDYLYHESFEKILNDQFSLPQAKGGWHLTDNFLATFAVRAVKELAKQRRAVMEDL